MEKKTAYEWQITLIAVLIGVELMASFLGTGFRYIMALHGQEYFRFASYITGPLTHGNLMHLLSNLPAVYILGTAVAWEGSRRWWQLHGFLFIVGSFLTILSHGRGQWIVGSSLLIFGYLGYLLTAARVEYNPKLRGWRMIIAVVVILFYGSTLISGFIPMAGISWKGHGSGFLAGLIAALYFMKRK